MQKNFLNKKDTMKIDFYLLDSADIINFEPIYRYLADAIFVADPTIEWLDFERTIDYLKERNLLFQTHPRANADCVITTQGHQVIEIPEYKHSVSMRLMYGLSEKDQNHQFHFNKGFDAILVPGQYSEKILKKYSYPIIIGFPKYDSFFRGEFNKNTILEQFKLDTNKKTILYLPTWRIHSSLDKYHDAIKKIIDSNEYNFIFKPHTVTIREEKYRINYFRQQINSKKMLCLEKQIGLDKLFTIADIILADGIGGAYWEAILVANLPTIAIYTKGDFEKKNLDRQIHKFAIVNNDPNLLIKDLKRVINEDYKFRTARKREVDLMIAFRDGTAGKRAAERIQNFIKSKKTKKNMLVSKRIYFRDYLAKEIRFFYFCKKWIKRQVKYFLHSSFFKVF